MTTTTPAPTTDLVPGVRTGPGRLRTASVALGASALTVAGLLAFPPWGDRLNSSEEDFLVYEKLQEVRDGAWAGLVVDGFAYAVLGLTLSLGVLHLARGRGRVAALVGAVLTTAGGILFAMGAAAFATFTWFVTAPGLSEGAGDSLVDYGNDHVARLLGIDMAGFLAFTLGTLVLAAALVRARAVPRPAVAVFVVLTLALFATPNDLLNYVQIAQMLLVVGFAGVVWRRA